MLLAGAAEHRAWGLLINYTNFSWSSPRRRGFRRGCSCCHLVQGWPRSGLQPCPAPHSTPNVNPSILQTVDLHYETSQQDFPSKIVMEMAYRMTEILATSIQVVANPISLLCANTCTETKQQKANRNSLLAPHMKGFLFGAH